MLFDKVTSELIYNASVQIWDVTMGLLDMEYRKCVICLCKRGVCIGLQFAVLVFTQLKSVVKASQLAARFTWKLVLAILL